MRAIASYAPHSRGVQSFCRYAYNGQRAEEPQPYCWPQTCASADERRRHRCQADTTIADSRNSGFVYLAVVMNLFSRRIIGWHLAENRQQSLTTMALWKAWKNRGMPTGMIIHSDRGVQYAASANRQFVTKRCKAQQSTPPLGKETAGPSLQWNRTLQRNNRGARYIRVS